MSNIKFKEIKPGMVIHCPTEENANALLAELDKLGYNWNTGKKMTGSNNYWIYEKNTCYKLMKNRKISYCDVKYFNSRGYEITEFSDLVEPELTAEEVLSILGEICEKSGGICDVCQLDYRKNDTGNDLCDAENFSGNEQEIIEICQKWKAEHEKKEPEVEWFWQGRILEKEDENLYQIENATYDTGCEYQESAEEFMSDVLKEFCKTHEGNYIAIVERVCRVKEE